MIGGEHQRGVFIAAGQGPPHGGVENAIRVPDHLEITRVIAGGVELGFGIALGETGVMSLVVEPEDSGEERKSLVPQQRQRAVDQPFELVAPLFEAGLEVAGIGVGGDRPLGDERAVALDQSARQARPAAAAFRGGDLGLQQVDPRTIC